MFPLAALLALLSRPHVSDKLHFNAIPIIEIFCEIHWGNLYGESYGKVSLAKNEVTKGLSVQDNSCWKGSDDLWLNYR